MRGHHDVATCRCGKDPAMVVTGQRYYIVCENPACELRPQIVRPRGGQAVKSWNAAVGVPLIRPAAAKRDGAPPVLRTSTNQLWFKPLIFTRRLARRLKARIRRGMTRLLFTVSRPGWRACKACPPKFEIDNRSELACPVCALPYSFEEAEAMVADEARDKAAQTCNAGGES